MYGSVQQPYLSKGNERVKQQDLSKIETDSFNSCCWSVSEQQRVVTQIIVIWVQAVGESHLGGVHHEKEELPFIVA